MRATTYSTRLNGRRMLPVRWEESAWAVPVRVRTSGLQRLGRVGQGSQVISFVFQRSDFRSQYFHRACNRIPTYET